MAVFDELMDTKVEMFLDENNIPQTTPLFDTYIRTMLNQYKECASNICIYHMKHHSFLDVKKYYAQANKQKIPAARIDAWVRQKQIAAKARALYKSKPLGRGKLSNVLTSNVQVKKNRGAIDSHFKELGYAGTVFRKYDGHYHYGTEARRFLTDYAHNLGYDGRVFRPNHQTYDGFDTYVKGKKKVNLNVRHKKVIIHYTYVTSFQGQTTTLNQTYYGTNISSQRAIQELIGSKENIDNYGASYIESIDSVIPLKLNQFAKVKKEDMPMKLGFILKQDWLKYAHGIAKTAYERTDDKCVPHQLREFFLHPPSKDPNQFVYTPNKIRTTSAVWFADESEGVTTKQIAALCKQAHRNMYAYDADDNCFCAVTDNTNNHYCPLVFYMINGHMYLIDDPDCILSAKENNKPDTAQKLWISDALTDERHKQKEQDHNNMNVTYLNGNMNAFINETFKSLPVDVCNNIYEYFSLPHLDIYDVNYAMDYSGTIIINKPDCEQILMEFVSKYQNHPRITMSNNRISGFSYKNKDDKKVNVVCDANYGQDIEYKQLRNVATQNDIIYINEGIGSVLCNLIAKSVREDRAYLTIKERQALIDEQGQRCRLCDCECVKFQIDHIKPLANGGTNNMENLQAICENCHAEKTSEEKETGYGTDADAFKSSFTEPVWKKIEPFLLTHQIVRQLEADVDVSETAQLDIVKCRRNIAKYSENEWAVYSVMDKIDVFHMDDEIVCGMYFVETEDCTLFQAHGWYSHFLVLYGLERGIINRYEISMKFLPSCVLPSHYFKKIVDYILACFECEPELQKKAVNSWVGMLGRRDGTVQRCKMSLDEQEAANWYCEQDKEFSETSDWDVWISRKRLENNQPVYFGVFGKDLQNEKTGYIIYKWILEMEKIELFKMEEMLIVRGYTPVEMKTDAIRYKLNKRRPFDASKYFWDNEQTVSKYRKDKNEKLKCHSHYYWRDGSSNFVEDFEMDWDVIDEYDDLDFVQNKILDKGDGLCVNGFAGTGKTYWVNAFLEKLDEREIEYLCLAPTNSAARLIDGETIHKFYNKFSKAKSKLFKKLCYYKYIIVDEISMVHSGFYEFFVLIKKTLPKLKFILVGDFQQFKPVKDEYKGNYETSQAVYNLCDGNRLLLTKCRRAEEGGVQLFNLYKAVRYCDNSAEPTLDKIKNKAPIDTDLNLAYTHQTRIMVNGKENRRFRQMNPHLKYIEIEPDEKNPKSQTMYLAKGVPLIAFKNHKDKKHGNEWLNSEQFVVDKINADDTVLINSDGEPIKVATNQIAKNFYLGFCITYHKSQGKTFDKPYTIWDWSHPRVDSIAKYVALSRTTHMKNIYIR